MQPWSAETGAERGSSRPGLPEPGPLCGARAPVSARSGRQACLMREVPCVVGLEVAQAQRESALRHGGARWAVPPRIVLAATGGLERAVTSAVATAGLPVGVVHPRQVRAWARATGQCAPPEAVEARARAHGATVLRPPPRPRPAIQPHALRALRGRLQTDRAAPRTGRHERRPTLDAARETRRRASPRWRDHDARWQRAPGRGPGCARTVGRALPAVGTRHRPQSAAGVGVAPRQGARGTMRGRRPRWGGRAHGRTVGSMGTLVATRDTPRSTAGDARLWAAGKGNKVALTAWCATREALHLAWRSMARSAR